MPQGQQAGAPYDDEALAGRGTFEDMQGGIHEEGL